MLYEVITEPDQALDPPACPAAIVAQVFAEIVTDENPRHAYSDPTGALSARTPDLANFTGRHRFV